MGSMKVLTRGVMSAFVVCGVVLGARDGRAGAPSIHGVNFEVKTLLDETFCLDASLDRGQEGREVYIFKCHGRENQRWTFTDGADGSSVIVGHLGMCLDIRNRKVGDGTP